MTDAAAVPQPQGNLCPKCGASLAEKAIACPSCGAQIVKAKPDKIELTTGQKIAAVVLIVNGLALVAEAVLIKDSDSIRGLKGALVSIVIGAYLFSGRPSALKWAKFAAIAGGVLYTGINIAQGDVFTAVSQFLYSLSLVGLLFGRAGKITAGYVFPGDLGLLRLGGAGFVHVRHGKALASGPKHPQNLISRQWRVPWKAKSKGRISTCSGAMRCS